jgi:hypothetical protein
VKYTRICPHKPRVISEIAILRAVVHISQYKRTYPLQSRAAHSKIRTILRFHSPICPKIHNNNNNNYYYYYKSFRKYWSSIPGKHEVKELRKTAILGTAHILQKVLM